MTWLGCMHIIVKDVFRRVRVCIFVCVFVCLYVCGPSVCVCFLVHVVVCFRLSFSCPHECNESQAAADTSSPLHRSNVEPET